MEPRGRFLRSLQGFEHLSEAEAQLVWDSVARNSMAAQGRATQVIAVFVGSIVGVGVAAVAEALLWLIGLPLISPWSRVVWGAAVGLGTLGGFSVGRRRALRVLLPFAKAAAER